MTDRITLLTWPDYVSPLTLEQFENETGVKVDLEVVPSAVELLERMNPKSRPPDLLVPPDYAVRELNAGGRLHVLEHSLIPNLMHLEPRFQRGRPHDRESRVSAIKDWGTTGFMFRSDMIHETLRSWADFWRLAEKFPGRVSVLDAPAEVIGAALKMRGQSYNSASASSLSAACDDLNLLKRARITFETNYRPLLASGQVYLSLGWNGDAAALKAQGFPIEYVIPSEGTQIWEDDWAMAADAPNPKMAYAFLNFVLRPDVAAQEARYTRYATGNRSARLLLEDDLRSDPSTYPPEDILQKLEVGMPLEDAGRQRREALWQEVRG
jgi:spermidine/putrescine transport system substrate-binding protein